MFKPLKSFQKFQFGSYLWLIFFEPQRYLFKTINWRTGFLLHNLRDKKPILKPVLIDTQAIFPNNSLLCLPLKKESWLSDIYNFWKHLDKPSLRVFVPLNCDAEKLNQYWPKPEQLCDLSYYKEIQK